MLAGKKILLAVSGSIAAYKAAFLTRLFVKAGAEVQVLMTEAATAFLSPLTFSTLSKREVYTKVIAEKEWNNHVELGLWADAMVVAPATANTLSKMASGSCNDIVSAVYLSARCPVFFAPAMDLDMWKHPATRRNLDLLQAYGHHLIPVGHGELASGLVGEGRMAEPEEIASFLSAFFASEKQFSGKKILVTAGPTYEPIDPVRFVGNRSSGKMGVAIAESFAHRGAEVHLVLGPSKLDVQPPHITVQRVGSAQEMHDAAVAVFAACDVAVMAAAVADYRPKQVAAEKIKKKGTGMTIEMERTPDIAATLGAAKKPHQFIVGFALETNNEKENAQQKLKKKNFDFIVLNSLQDPGAGFNFDTNKITIISKDNKAQEFELKSKAAVAEDIVNEVWKQTNN